MRNHFLKEKHLKTFKLRNWVLGLFATFYIAIEKQLKIFKLKGAGATFDLTLFDNSKMS